MTIRVASGHPERWTGLTRVGIGREPDDPEPEMFGVESARGYRDRLVLKLAGLDTRGEVETRRGRWILAPPEEVPELPAGTWYVERLRGLQVEDGRRGPLGRVEDVLETGGVDLLVVQGGPGGELLIPLAETIVKEVREEGQLRLGVLLQQRAAEWLLRGVRWQRQGAGWQVHHHRPLTPSWQGPAAKAGLTSVSFSFSSEM